MGVRISGRVAPEFNCVVEAFERNFVEGGEVGAAFAAYVDGSPVVDVWGGVANRAARIPWAADTLVPVFSGTKGLVATCMLLLIERGALALDAPVSKYWPEFSSEGKRTVLVRDVVAHEAGLPGLLTPVSVEEATDHLRLANLLAMQRPIDVPAGQLIYHALTFGWLCGELVRRIDGRTLGLFLREEVAEPLGLEVWIGLPAELEPRVALIEAQVDSDNDLDALGEVDEIARSIWSNPPRFASGALAANLPAWHQAEIPGTNGIVSARSMARLYGCLACGGELDGVCLLRPETIEAGRRRLSLGDDPYLGAPLSFATGFQVQTSESRFGPPPEAFGHTGAGGSVHGAWPRQRTAFSYAPNLLRDNGTADRRAKDLLSALYSAVSAPSA